MAVNILEKAKGERLYRSVMINKAIPAVVVYLDQLDSWLPEATFQPKDMQSDAEPKLLFQLVYGQDFSIVSDRLTLLRNVCSEHGVELMFASKCCAHSDCEHAVRCLSVLLWGLGVESATETARLMPKNIKALRACTSTTDSRMATDWQKGDSLRDGLQRIAKLPSNVIARLAHDLARDCGCDVFDAPLNACWLIVSAT